MLNDFLSLSWPFEILLLKISCLDLYPIFKLDYLVFWCLVSWVLYIFWRFSPLSDMISEDFFPVCGLPFCLQSVFALQKLFSFSKSHLLIVSFQVCVTGVVFRKFSWQYIQAPSQFLFCQIECNWIYVEVFDPLELEFCTGR